MTKETFFVTKRSINWNILFINNIKVKTNIPTKKELISSL